MIKKIFILFLAQCFFSIGLHAAEGKEILLLRLDDYIINPITAEYVIESITRAEENQSSCVIIHLDTPGGLLNATRAIVKKILNAEIPVVVYVSPSGSRAASAGVFITLAAHIAAMAPSTNIGAAHPVTIGGSGPDFKKIVKKLKEKGEKKDQEQTKKEDADAREKQQKEQKQDNKEVIESGGVMNEKIVNDTVAWIRSIAHTRGRNEEWAEKSVRESVSITEQEALEKDVIDIVAANLNELLAAIDGKVIGFPDNKTRTLKTKNMPVKEVPMNFRQKFLNVLTNPNIAYILMILGFYGLLYEFTHPGIGFPGIAGAISIILAFYSMQTLPTNYAGVALIGLAIALFIAEVFVTSFGLLTLGGIVSMTLGSLILFDSPADYLRVSLHIVIPFVLATAFIMVFLIRLAIKAYRKKSVTGQEGMINATGEARGAVDRQGKVFVNGEIWNAESDERIDDKEKINVIAVRGMVLKIKKEKEG